MVCTNCSKTRLVVHNVRDVLQLQQPSVLTLRHRKRLLRHKRREQLLRNKSVQKSPRARSNSEFSVKFGNSISEKLDFLGIFGVIVKKSIRKKKNPEILIKIRSYVHFGNSDFLTDLDRNVEARI